MRLVAANGAVAVFVLVPVVVALAVVVVVVVVVIGVGVVIGVVVGVGVGVVALDMLMVVAIRVVATWDFVEASSVVDSSEESPEVVESSVAATVAIVVLGLNAVDVP